MIEIDNKNENENMIVYNKNGDLVALVGKDAVSLMIIQVIISGIKLHIRSGGKIKLSKRLGIRALLNRATHYTGKKYTLKDLEKAIEDLNEFFLNMKLSMPYQTIDE